jgi:hypothetical protein
MITMAIDCAQIISGIDFPIDHPRFYEALFSAVARKNKLEGLEKTCCDEFDILSQRLLRSDLQEDTAVRNVVRTRLLANSLIDEKGELNLARLSQAIALLQKSLYSLGPNRQYDVKRQEHLLKALRRLHSDKELQLLLRKTVRPHQNRYAEQIIRETIQAPKDVAINDPQARRAVLAAWLCTLRQNVGSCFGTAPCILIHDEQPTVLLKDLNELLATGRLKRTFGGNEHSIPMSSSWGAGDVRRPFLLQLPPTSNEGQEIWLSPGLLLALESIDLIDKTLPLKGRIAATKRLILKVLNHWPSDEPCLLLTVEDLLKAIILDSLQLSYADLEEHEQQPRQPFTGSLVMQSAMAMGPRAKQFQTFYQKLDLACSAFKALADNALLKCWEFTVASFAESKLQFANWNLYSSLGLAPDDSGGIGHAIFRILKAKLDDVNRQIQERQYDYESALTHIRYLETRLRTASSEQDAQWIKMEYRTRKVDFDRMEGELHLLQRRARTYASSFELLIDLYMGLFPNFFQEVYDADMHEIAAGPYDDSPAGFRLLYKHGRSNTSLWTPIKNPNDFVEALASFFVMCEAEIAHDPSMGAIADDISEITSGIVAQLRTAEFLESSFVRMAHAHHTAPIRDPLNNLDKISKKPWAYTSGGTMDTLVANYWCREQKPTEVGRWVESPTELLLFFIDTLKQIPAKLSAPYFDNPQKALLIHSPTHAFLLKPGQSPLKELWQTEQFTYTAVRDQLIVPATSFIDSILLDNEKCLFIVEKLNASVPPNFRYYFRQVFSYFPGTFGPIELRNHLVENIAKERGLGFGRGNMLKAEMIDSKLFEWLPLTPRELLRERVLEILKLLPLSPAALAQFDSCWEALTISQLPSNLITARTLQDIAKGFLCLLTGKSSLSYDGHLHVSLATRQLGYALPMPLLFGDSNWVHDEFAFVVNPGTGRYELWRCDHCAITAAPMAAWEQWLNGSQRDRTWGIYTQPYEYSFV